MKMDKIIQRHREIEQELHKALSTMEKKDTIIQLREELKNLQNECPHFSNKYNWEAKEDICPYCGKQL